MPAKKHQITDAERAKRIREAAREHETSNDPAEFERAVKGVVRPANKRGDKKAEETRKLRSAGTDTNLAKVRPV
jgi:hypothetical protein